MNTFIIVGGVALVVGGIEEIRQRRKRKAELRLSNQEFWHEKFVPSLNDLVAKHSVNLDEKGTPLPARRFTVASRFDDTDLQLILDGKPVALFIYSKDARPARQVTVSWTGTPIEYYRAEDFFAQGREVERRIRTLPHLLRPAA